MDLEAALRRLNWSEELALEHQVAHADADRLGRKADGDVRTAELVDKLAERQVELDRGPGVVPGEGRDLL